MDLYNYVYCNSHSNAETMWMVFPSTTTSRVCVKAISVRWLQEIASYLRVTPTTVSKIRRELLEMERGERGKMMDNEKRKV